MEREEFAELVREHGDVVFGVVVRRVRDREVAADLAQETFLRAWRARGSLRDVEAARGWLCAIAVNVVRDHVRRGKARPVTTEELPDLGSAADDPAIRAEQAEEIDRLAAALRALPDNHREMLLLRERDGLSYREIAGVMGCPIGSVMSGLARAREKLAEAVDG